MKVNGCGSTLERESTSSEPSRVSSEARFLGLALSGEAGLVLLAWGLARWMDVSLAQYLRLSGSGFLWGLAATLPLLVGLVWLLGSPPNPVRALLDTVVDQIGPLVSPLSRLELGLLALVAGISEEVLFRGVLQAGLAQWLSPGGALLASSLLFGLVHYASHTYAVLASVMGLYLGGLFLAQQSLLAPIVTHALYDFVALVLVVNLYRQRTARMPA